jgi:hypothetical protein
MKQIRMLAGAFLVAAIAVAQPPPAGGRGRGKSAPAPVRTPVIVELFTSEGCSSCPPADDVLTRLEREQPVPGVEIIPLSEHVDYWNDLGWQDRFSSPLFSGRQQDYGHSFRLESVYTPELVVNGQTETVGSDWNAVTKAISLASGGDRATVRAAMLPDNTVAFSVKGLPAGTRVAEIYLAVTESNLESAVLNGENTGRHLTHTGVVRSLTTLGRLDTSKNAEYSSQARLTLNPQWNRKNLKLVLFVQEPANRHILGASAVRP